MLTLANAREYYRRAMVRAFQITPDPLDKNWFVLSVQIGSTFESFHTARGEQKQYASVDKAMLEVDRITGRRIKQINIYPDDLKPKGRSK